MKKIRPARRPGEITIVQTRDADAIAAMATAAGALTDEYQRPGSCVLIAYEGDNPVGIVAVLTVVETGRVALLWVAEARRRRGIGTALVSAARKAAHTRGAQRLLAAGAADTAGFLQKLSFEPTADPNQPWMLDISRDGIIER